MPNTARTHFDQDIARAEAVAVQADLLEVQGSAAEVVNDIRLAAVGMAVGALDAYLSDKYVDCLTMALRAYSRGAWRGEFPDPFAKSGLPAGVILDVTKRRVRPAWALRVAARSLMEKESMLKIGGLEGVR